MLSSSLFSKFNSSSGLNIFACFQLSKSYGEIDDDDWENELDIFTTPIDDNPDMDEYIKFKTSFEGKLWF